MKVIAVTGGAQGIGRASAFHFARAGYAVSVADGEAGEEAIRKLREMGRQCLLRPDGRFGARRS